MKVGFISLGCAKNLVDSEFILGIIHHAGIEIVSDAAAADIVMINTCGFIAPAKSETLETIAEMHALGKKVVVLGCYAERYRESLAAQMPFIFRIITLKDYPKIHLLLEEVFHDPALKLAPLRFETRLLTGSSHSPYVKISEGCDNRCTYCAIPLIRGPYRSRAFTEIIAECRQLVSGGAKELNLISQDTSRYGSDFADGTSLVSLVRAISAIAGVWLVRLLYLYPDEITDELLAEISANPKVAKYFDIPIQHIADPVLKRMHRRGSAALIRNLIAKIRELMPEAIIRTTLIVGFPGETEADYLMLKDFVAETRFDRLGVFAYSREEDTPAWDMEDQIDEQTKQARLAAIMSLQKQIARRKHKTQIGSIHETLVEAYDEESKFYYGRSYAFAPDDADGYIVFQSKRKLASGAIADVLIKEAIMYDLLGDAVD